MLYDVTTLQSPAESTTTKQDLSPLNYLGYGLDLLEISPFDITSAAQSVKKRYQIIKTDSDRQARQGLISQAECQVSEIAAINVNYRITENVCVTYPRGSEALKAFGLDASLRSRLLAFSGGSPVYYGLSKTFRDDCRFALYGMSSIAYEGSLHNYGTHLAEDALEKRLTRLTTPFPENPSDDVVREYRAFFECFGSHVIIGTLFGSRFQLIVWSPKSINEPDDKWFLNVNAAFNGLFSNGNFDSSIKDEAQYEHFLKTMQKKLSISGGNQSIALEVFERPDDYETYVKWMRTLQEQSNVIGFQVTEIWNVVHDAEKRTIRARAGDIQNAFEYIQTQSLLYKTQVVFFIQSDWAEFGLLSPNARITVVRPVTNATTSPQKIHWRVPEFLNPVIINFSVTNDGSPIDFYISHGSDSKPGMVGEARIYIRGEEYVNDQRTDHKWNAKRFYKAPVSSNWSEISRRW